MNCAQSAASVSVYPNAAITNDSAFETNRQACIRCYTCIKSCTTGARVMIHPFFAREARWLHDTFPERKEPEKYL